jgi:hypothetical protein
MLSIAAGEIDLLRGAVKLVAAGSKNRATLTRIHVAQWNTRASGREGNRFPRAAGKHSMKKWRLGRKKWAYLGEVSRGGVHRIL